ncbi:RrF2 family transcriptional regulator [Tabrizicola fusiformis]|uniref:RrF2 family transcriptional regulator n=1 Tax=Tabrizicola sp. SY72 TaxID=2741673 RepID=UPI00157466D3|nr:Rrf2 family transcriptional regulator [Tabrizicola sp. SY72]NTT87694.1 Rrf2 family transcriptional regulator [Tabrizicola sp. SY72]
MLTMKGKYGLKALSDMALADPGAVLQSAEIAQRHGISKKFLDAILADLRLAGIVVTRKGRSGGYRLARPADVISVGEVLRVLDGPLAPIACASRSAYVPCTDCRDERACAVRLAMLEVRDAVASVLDRKTLIEMATAGLGRDRLAVAD